MKGKFRYGTYSCFPRPIDSKKANGKPRKQARYLRISAGPQKGKYVHDIIMEAVMGRELEGDETVEHRDGNGLNVHFSNLIVVTREVNTRLRVQREKRARAREAGQQEMRWEGAEVGEVGEEAPF